MPRHPRPRNPGRCRYTSRLLGRYLADLIVVARQRRNITQEQIARQIGITPTPLSQYVHGVSLPSPEVRRQIVRVLGADEAELIARELGDRIGLLAESIGEDQLPRALRLVRKARRK